MNEILQFGEGNFLRAFIEYYIQLAKENNNYNGNVVICQPRNNTKIINALNSQQCKYNVLLRGRYAGKVVDEVKEINCVSKCIDTVGQYNKLVELFTSDDLKLVVSNTTEAGITFVDTDKIENSPNVSFPAKITALLYERFKSKRNPLVFLPVELIENNGDELKHCVIKYAKLWDLGVEFENYVISCSFCNTLVDRIVTGYVDYKNDLCAVACEPYRNFVIMADNFAKSLLEKIFYDDTVTFTKDLSLFRTRKVRILNGAHTMSVLGAYNMGYEIVRDMLHDDLINTYIKKGLFDEIIPTIDLPKNELEPFANSVLERFDNPFIDHKLLDISLNSVSKFKSRCLCSIIDYIKLFGKSPKVLSFGLSALINFYAFSNKDYQPNDNQNVLDFFASQHKDIVYDVMSNVDFWGADLTAYQDFYNQVAKNYNNIKAFGVRKAMEILCNEQTVED